MKLTRRDLLRWGIMLGGGAALSGGRLSRASNLPESPPTRPFVVELTRDRDGWIPPIAQPVGRFDTKADPGYCVNVDGTRAFHVHGPRTVPYNTEFFMIHERLVNHSFHPDLPLNPLWGYTDLFDRKTVLALRNEVGVIPFGTSPTYERFYLGGIGELRGFKFRGVSPRSGPLKDPIGGDFEWMTTAVRASEGGSPG